jgi:hypothetical protein
MNVVRVGSNEDCRNREFRTDEMFVKFNFAHRRHMDVSDQGGSSSGHSSEVERGERRRIRTGQKS